MSDRNNLRNVALTVCQPYAWMILARDPINPRLSLKPIENRRWWTGYRGPLWIHAGKSRDWMRQGLTDLRQRGIEPPEEFAFGVLLGQVELVDCRQVRGLAEDLRDHPTAEGPYCWVLRRPRRLLAAIELPGKPGIFPVPGGVLRGAQLERVCRECGCTDDAACPGGGCYWVTDDLCSACAEREPEENS